MIPLTEQLDPVYARVPVKGKDPSEEATVPCASVMERLTLDPPAPITGPLHVPLIDGTALAVAVPLSLPAHPPVIVYVPLNVELSVEVAVTENT